MDRRDFLKLGGLIIGFHAGRPSIAGASGMQPNAWLRIGATGDITVLVEASEVGQGTWTSLAMLVAEELDADWSKVHAIAAPPDPNVYKNMTTGGSGGLISAWDDLRRAGAQAREMLVAAAADRWDVEKASCRTERSRVIHTATGRSFSYGELVDAASKIAPADPTQTVLKKAKDYKIIGRPIPRQDVPGKVDGSATYGMDVRVPGMLYAVVARCPTFGGNPAAFDAQAAKAIPGVLEVVEIPPLDRPANSAGGIAVVGENTWAAIQGRNALKITWDRGPNAAESSASLRELAQTQLQGPATHVVRETGSFGSGGRTIEALYELPFQPHASMEPMNCVADVHSDRIEMWTGTQCPIEIAKVLARVANVPEESITVHNQLSGGAFGRRWQWDYPLEAWQISKAIGKPVKLVWTREDDLRHDFYRQLSYHGMRARLGDDGKPREWTHRIVSTAIREVFDSPERLKDPAAVARQELSGSNIPYAIPNVRVDFAPLRSGVPRAWWRSVASSFNAFAVECFIDELAGAAKRDPLQFRLDLLPEEGSEDPEAVRRLRAVLELSAQKGDWGKPVPAGWGRGIAAHLSFGTFVAYVATVSKESTGAIKVRKVVGAVDCGTAVNPDSVTAMIEGSIIYGLSATMEGEVTVANGAIVQSNFDGYRPLRMSQSPAIEVHIVNSGGKIAGMGEPGVPPIAPAVANAVFAATGKRVRRLPLTPVRG